MRVMWPDRDDDRAVLGILVAYVFVCVSVSLYVPRVVAGCASW